MPKFNIQIKAIRFNQEFYYKIDLLQMASQVSLEQQIIADLHPEVAGRVNKPAHVQFWEKVIKAPPLPMKILREGFKVCFENNILPGPTKLKNNSSARKEQEFVDISIKRMVEIGVCSESRSPPYISNPVSVVDTGKRDWFWTCHVQ